MALKIHHLNCGTMCPHGAPLINGYGKLTDNGHMVCHCLLIESNDGLVLVDTGLGIEDTRNPTKRLGHAFMAAVRPTADYRETAFLQIKDLGFKPEDVRHILVTHLDLDHAGGIGDFPQAKVHLFAPEFRAAMNPNWREKSRYMPHQWAHSPQWVTYETEGEDWHGFDSIRAIPELDDANATDSDTESDNDVGEIIVRTVEVCPAPADKIVLEVFMRGADEFVENFLRV